MEIRRVKENYILVNSDNISVERYGNLWCLTIPRVDSFPISKIKTDTICTKNILSELKAFVKEYSSERDIIGQYFINRINGIFSL